jgi:NDP-sugar pyrophosphorylase family protein
MKMQALILAGGLGTRLSPYTAILPKPLMPVGQMPILELIIRQLHYYGVHRFTLAVSYLGTLLQTYFGDGSRFGVRIDYQWEEHPLGTAGAISLFEPEEDDFLVMNGDILTTLNYLSLLSAHKREEPLATIAAFEKQVKIDLGVLEINEQGLLKDYVEKPIKTYKVSMGINVFNKKVLGHLKAEEHIDIPELMLLLKGRGERIFCYSESCEWYDIGRVEDFALAQQLVQENLDKFLPGGSK